MLKTSCTLDKEKDGLHIWSSVMGLKPNVTFTLRWKSKTNRPFPSSLLPLFENESKCETFHMKMSFTHKSIRMQIILIFI